MSQTISQKLIAKLGADLKEFKAGLRSAVSEAKAAGQRMKTSLRAATDGAVKLGKAVGVIGVALAGLGALAVREFVQWEEAMTGVAKTVNATDEEIRALGDAFVRMSEAIPVSANELAKLGEVAGQLGIALPNIREFVEVAAALGVSTNLSGEEAAVALARFSNVMGTATEDVDRLGSTLVDLGNNLATTEAEILDMSLRITGAGRQIGLTEAQVLSFAGALSSLGINAEAGGTAISRVFAMMASAVASGGDELKAFAKVAGTTASDFASRFRTDAAGAVIDFIGGLKRLSDEGENVFAVLESVGMQDIRIRDTMLRASGGVDLLRQAMELGSVAWEENTALAAEAERFYDRLGARLVQLRNKLSNVAAEIGESLAPVVDVMIGLFSGFLDQVRQAGPAIAEFAETAASRIPAMAEAAVNALGEVGLKIVSVVEWFESHPLAGGMGLLGLVFFGPAGAAVLGTIGAIIDSAIAMFGGPQTVAEALADKMAKTKREFEKFLQAGELDKAAELSRQMEGIQRTIDSLTSEDFVAFGETGTGVFASLTEGARGFFEKMAEWQAQAGGGGDTGGIGEEAEKARDAYAELSFIMAPLPLLTGEMAVQTRNAASASVDFSKEIRNAAEDVSSGIGRGMTDVLTMTNSVDDALKQVGKTIMRAIVGALVQATIQATILKAIMSTFGLPMPIPVPGFAAGGVVPGGPQRPFPAVLHGGEVVLNRDAVASLGGTVAANALNTGAPSGGGGMAVRMILPDEGQMPNPVDFGIMASQPSMIRFFVELMRQAKFVGAVE